MIKKIFSLIIGLVALSQPLVAQNDAAADGDSWIIYDRVASDGMSLVVLALKDNPQAQTLLQTGHATAVVCRADSVSYMRMRQDIARLYSLEDRIAADAALRAAGAIHIASVTGQDQRRIFVVHPNLLDLSPILDATPISGYSCAAEAVVDRLPLIQLVTPTAIDIQLAGDQSVIMNLEKNGDNGSAARKTDFWFYGPRASLDKLAADLQTHGFSVDHLVTSPEGIVLSREMLVTMATFRTLTPVLINAAQNSGVQYDGWETVVVQPSTQP